MVEVGGAQGLSVDFWSVVFPCGLWLQIIHSPENDGRIEHSIYMHIIYSRI